MNKEDKPATAMLAGQAAEHSVSSENSGAAGAGSPLVYTRPEIIDFAHIKLKLFSLYFNLIQILTMLYN